VLVQMPVLLPCLPPARFTVFGCKLHRQPANFPSAQIEQIQPQAECHFSQNIYISDGVHVPHRHCSRRQPLNGGRKKTKINFVEDSPLQALVAEHKEDPLENNQGEERVQLVQTAT